jgi:hypothetical protein
VTWNEWPLNIALFLDLFFGVLVAVLIPAVFWWQAEALRAQADLRAIYKEWKYFQDSRAKIHEKGCAHPDLDRALQQGLMEWTFHCSDGRLLQTMWRMDKTEAERLGGACPEFIPNWKGVA